MAAWPGLAGAWDGSCVWGLAHSSLEVSASVRRSRQRGPAPGRRGRPGGGGPGAAPEVPAASRPLIRNSFGMNSGVPASVSARPTHRFLPGPPSAGWEARPGLPGTPRPPLGPVPPPPSPGPGQAGKGLGGRVPLLPPLLPGPGWCGLPANSCSCPPGAGRGTGREGKARRAWTGQSPAREPQQRRSEEGHLLGWGCQAQQGT